MSDRPEPRRRFGVPSPQDDVAGHAVAMVAAPVAFGLLGAWFDSLLGTGWLIAATLAGLGVAGSFASAYYRYEARMAAHDEGKPWARRARR